MTANLLVLQSLITLNSLVGGDSVTKLFKQRCKDCDKYFSYTDYFREGEQVRNATPPERCINCRKKNSQFVRDSGAAYWVAPLEKDDSKRCWGQYGIGKICREALRIEEIEYEGVSIDNPPEKFNKIAPIAEKLISNLEDPNGTQISVVVAPTGTGKSTWIPYRILRSELSESGKIIVTSPRKAPLREDTSSSKATSVPGYIARVLCNSPGVGPGQEVGILYRGQKEQHDKYSRLLFITDGLLIRFLTEENLDDLSVIVIDEAHEQTKNMELIFAMIKAKVRAYPNLKIVIASATIDIDKFVNYFGEGKKESVFVAQPENIDVSTPFEIKRRSLEELFHPNSRFGDYVKVSSEWEIPKLAAKVVGLIATDPGFTLHRNTKGDILVFMPTLAFVDKTIEAIEGLCLQGVDILPCHAQLDRKAYKRFSKSEERAQLAFQEGRQTNPQRIIVATDYVETSATLPNLMYVVDSGFAMDPGWDSISASFRFLPDRHSLAGCKQRAGRVGRTQSGEYFPLYDSEQESEMKDYTLPEIARTPLDTALLSLSEAGITELELVDWLGAESINPEEANRSISALKARGAIDENGMLTRKGAELSKIQVDTIDIAKAVSDSDRYGCSLEVATFMAFVALKSSFIDRKNEEKALKYVRFIKECKDDFEFYLKLVELLNTKTKNNSELNEVFEQGVSDVFELRDKFLENYTKRTHTNISSREINYEQLDKARFIIARSAKEWIYSKEKDNAGTSYYMPRYPDICPYGGQVIIDRDSSIASKNNIETMMCVGRVREGRAETLFAKNILALSTEWLEYIDENDPFVLTKLFRSMSLDRNESKTLRKRIRNQPQKAKNIELEMGSIYSFKVERRIESDTGSKSVVELVVEELGSNHIFLAHVYGIHESVCLPNYEFRAVAKKQDQEHLALSVDDIKKRIKKGQVIKAARLVQPLIGDQDNVYGYLFEIDTGITARLLVNSGCGPKGAKDLRLMASGDFCELVILENEKGHIKLATPMAYKQRNRVISEGDDISGMFKDIAQNKEKDVIGCDIDFGYGATGFLPLAGVCHGRDRDLAAIIVQSWRRGSTKKLRIKRCNRDNDYQVELLWPELTTTRKIVGYVAGFLSSSDPRFTNAGAFVLLNHSEKGLLHWKNVGNHRLESLSFGDKLEVKILAIETANGKKKYDLYLP